MPTVSREEQHHLYNCAYEHFCKNPNALIEMEKYLVGHIQSLFREHWQEIRSDYDEASFLLPFWENYPPEDRGRKPKGDQVPWIEVGEHAIGGKCARLLMKSFSIRDTGLPTGPDLRMVLRSDRLQALSNNYTDSAFLFIDIKSAGPRDDAPHAVMSHNQVSGNGRWRNVKQGLKNTPIKAKGARTSHDFHCSIPPIYVLSDGTVAPVINIVVKPVYSMNGDIRSADFGQPLKRITLACIPNGILLFSSPRYIGKYPGLFFPGKDDKTKNPLKMRARVSFELLGRIDAWRVVDIQGPA